MARTATSKRRLTKKRSVDLSSYNKFWEMRQKRAGVNEKTGKIENREVKVFKCMECGAETDAKGDFGGTPDIHKCTPECRHHTINTMLGGRVTDAYRVGYDRINWNPR